MSSTKIIAVVGATGAQGGGLARAILADPDHEFAVRAITRDPDSDKARALAAAGAEVVRADLDRESSLAAAFEGAYGAYLVTNFWEHMSGQKELTQAGALARAAGAAGLSHAIWSTLEDTRDHIPVDDTRMPTLQGSYKVPHFDAKAESDALFIRADVPVTFLRTTFYWENLIYFGLGPQRTPDGNLIIAYPIGASRLAGIAAEDIGKCALAIFKGGPDFIGKTVSIAGEHLTAAEMAGALTEAIGEKVTAVEITPDAFRALGFPGADEVGNMFQYYAEAEADFTGARDLAAVRALNPGLQDFAAWLATHKGEIPVP